MSFNLFMKELNGKRVEGELTRAVFYSLLTSLVFLAIIWYFRLQGSSGIVSQYGPFLFLAALGYAFITPAIHQVRAYKELPCMAGMMIGMTLGMISGFLAGFFIGATNGMFIGSIFGMAVGIIIGVWNGKCCGIMGSMEGMMAGFMGGIMGAMTSVMMLNDHLQSAAVIITLISAVILFSLNYLIYREMKESESQMQKDYFITIGLSFILIVITTWLMLYGPRSGLFG